MTDEPDLTSLIDDVRSGQQAAFATLIARVQSRVRAWAARFTSDEDEADDVAQEVLIGLQRSVLKYHGQSRFTTWLFAVTRNAALLQRRTEGRRANLRNKLAAEDILVAPDGVSDQDSQTVASLILTYFDTLPPKQRLIFELVDLRGHEPAEVARQLGMQQTTVRGHLFKARRRIRARMLALHEPLMTEYLS